MGNKNGERKNGIENKVNDKEAVSIRTANTQALSLAPTLVVVFPAPPQYLLTPVTQVVFAVPMIQMRTRGSTGFGSHPQPLHHQPKL